jgi:DNA ligase-1
MDEFEAGHSPAPYRVRWARIPQGTTSLIAPATTVWPSLDGFDPHFIEGFLGEYMADGGFDGIIFHDPEGTWTAGDGKTGEIIKIKPTVSFDLRIKGVIEGKTGKQKGKVGAIVFEWRDGQTVQCVGGSHEELEAWWNDPSLIVGKIGEVEAMCVNQYGQLREPRFKGIRFDKLEPDV